MTPSTEPSSSGRALLTRCPPTTRTRVVSIVQLEGSATAEQEYLALVTSLVKLVEEELVRLLLEPLRPWGEALAEVVEETKSARRAADTLRHWSLGDEIHNVVAFSSQVFQALRKGCRSGDPKVGTLVEVFFSPELRSRLAKPELGLTLERVRTRFRDPVVRETGTFTLAEYEDLVRIVLGTERVAVWYAEGPEQEGQGVLDLLIRGTRVPSGRAHGVPGAGPRVGSETTEVGPWDVAETAIVPGPQSEDPTVGGRLGQDELRGELGRGGMGVVFKGWDPTLGREVAIKVLRCAAEAGHDALERFGREARAVARLQHEGIVVVHEVAECGSQPYLVMQYVEGRTLEAWLGGEPTIQEVCCVGRQVALALHYAHEQGVAHRDVKPTNIMIDPRGRAVLMDFGLALELSARTRLTVTGQILGTPAYMAPEQIEGDLDAIGVASDVYSLGAVLYRALCGRAPFEASSPTALFKKVLLDEPAPPRSVNPLVPAGLDALVLRCLTKAPALRWPSAAALADELEGWL